MCSGPQCKHQCNTCNKVRKTCQCAKSDVAPAAAGVLSVDDEESDDCACAAQLQSDVCQSCFGHTCSGPLCKHQCNTCNKVRKTCQCAKSDVAPAVTAGVEEDDEFESYSPYDERFPADDDEESDDCACAAQLQSDVCQSCFGHMCSGPQCKHQCNTCNKVSKTCQCAKSDVAPGAGVVSAYEEQDDDFESYSPFDNRFPEEKEVKRSKPRVISRELFVWQWMHAFKQDNPELAGNRDVIAQKKKQYRKQYEKLVKDGLIIPK